MLIDQFIQSFDRHPQLLTLDVDVCDDPAHGQQQLTLLHGYYGNHQYRPIVVTSTGNDAVLLIGLRHGTCGVALGAKDGLRNLTARLRAAWPESSAHVRGDDGFGVPGMHQVLTELRLIFTFGLGMNPQVKELTQALLEQAQAEYQRTGQPQRLFDRALTPSPNADSWPAPRQIVIEAEANALGTNHRAVAANHPCWEVLPQCVFAAHAELGEWENRNQELKCDLQADRLSDHRFLANFLRSFLHVAALILP